MMLKVLRCVCTSTTSACKPLSFWSWLSVSVCSDAAWAVPATSSAANGAMSSPFNIVSPSVDVLLLGTSWGCTHGPDNYTGGRQGGAQDGRGAGEGTTARQLLLRSKAASAHLMTDTRAAAWKLVRSVCSGAPAEASFSRGLPKKLLLRQSNSRAAKVAAPNEILIGNS